MTVMTLDPCISFLQPRHPIIPLSDIKDTKISGMFLTSVQDFEECTGN